MEPRQTIASSTTISMLKENTQIEVQRRNNATSSIMDSRRKIITTMRPGSIYLDAVENESDFEEHEYSDRNIDGHGQGKLQGEGERNERLVDKVFNLHVNGVNNHCVPSSVSSLDDGDSGNRNNDNDEIKNLLSNDDKNATTTTASSSCSSQPKSSFPSPPTITHTHTITPDSQLQSKLHKEQITKLHEERTREIEEILTQLNQIESSYQSQIHDLRTSLEQKEIIISTLGEKLSDANRVIFELSEDKRSDHVILEELQVEKDDMNRQLDLLKDQMESVWEEHQRAIQGERKKREMEVKHVELAIKEAAELQFEEANRVFLELQKDFNVVKNYKENLERQKKINDVDNAALISQLRADVASANAELLKRNKNHEVAMEDMSEKERLLQISLKESRANSTAAHLTLATVVKDKEMLAKEVKDLNDICEELIGIVEQGKKT